MKKKTLTKTLAKWAKKRWKEIDSEMMKQYIKSNLSTK